MINFIYNAIIILILFLEVFALSVKLFHTADLHIGAEVSYLGERAEARRFELLSVFKRIVDFCVKENVEICLIAGDLFDSNAAAEEFCGSVFEYIRSAPQVKFFYVSGNHDPLDAASVTVGRPIPENLFVFGTEYEVKELPSLGVRIVGKSFAHSSMDFEDMNTVLPEDGLINIMLLHADISSDKLSPYNPITRDFIENSGVDYLALGHIHKRTAPTRFGKTVFAYSGSPEGHGFDEEGVRGGYLVNISKDSCEHSFVRLSKRVHRVERIDVSAAVSSPSAAEIILKKLEESYGESFSDDLYKIILVGNVEKSLRLRQAEILQILAERLYFVKLKDQTRPAYDFERLREEVGLKGLFVKNMLKKAESADQNEKELLEAALYIGLAAFDSEVTANED